MEGGSSKLRFFDVNEYVTTGRSVVRMIDFTRHLDCQAQGTTEPLDKAESWLDDSCERVY